MKKGNLLPILLIAGAAYAFMAFRRRPGVTVTADMPIRQPAEEFEADTRGAQVKSSLIDAGTKLISNLFAKKTERQKTAKRVQATAVKRAVKSGTATRKQAKAVTKSLSQGIGPIRIGFDDNQVLC